MKKGLVFIVGLGLGVAQAAIPRGYVDSSALPGFGAAVNAAGSSVIFPSAVLKKSAIFAEGEAASKGGYTIYLNATADCGVAAYCNLAHFNASPASGALPIYRNSHHQVMTRFITLKNGTKATYTQGYAMADYWPPHIDWMSQGMLYSLTYSSASKSDLLWMVNHMRSFSSKNGDHGSGAPAPVPVSQT